MKFLPAAEPSGLWIVNVVVLTILKIIHDQVLYRIVTLSGTVSNANRAPDHVHVSLPDQVVI